MIKYIGSKRRLVPRLVALVSAIPRVRTVLDLFTGSTRVAQGLKAAGFTVTANDLATYSEALATTYIAVDGAAAPLGEWRSLVSHLNTLPGVRGYFTRTFCEDARYVQPKNGMRVDAMRAELDRIAPNGPARAMLLTALLEAADRVDSTTGLQMAYLKAWSPRSHRDIALRLPALLPGTGTARREDALDLVRRGEEFDVAYLDPPYNQHSYYSNYHVWETLVRGDAPTAYGIARKRDDCRRTKSPFNARGTAWPAFREVVFGVRARHVVVSFSDEGFFTTEAITGLLAERFGEVAAVPVASRRYVGARIGIHNLRGERVGKVGRLGNTEWIFLAGPDAAGIAAIAAAAEASPAETSRAEAGSA
ncbi:MAG: DNA adenine methylase [Gemmatimonadaceae bacterium]